jgi:hypothetical protein
MAKKKKETTMDTNGTPQTLPVELQAATVVIEPPQPLAEPPPSSAVSPQTNGTRRPAASWKYPAAAGVTVEVALWPHTVTLQSGETIEVFNATVTRSYRDQQGQWQRGGSFRIAEIPVLIHALLRAHGFALDAREQNCPI